MSRSVQSIGQFQQSRIRRIPDFLEQQTKRLALPKSRGGSRELVKGRRKAMPMARKKRGGELKAVVVKLVTELGHPVAEAAKRLGVERTLLRN